MANVAPAIAGTVEGFAGFATPEGTAITDMDLLDFWFAEAAAAGHSTKTVKERVIVLRALRRHMGKPLVNAERPDLIRFLGQAHLSKNSRQTYGQALRSFYTLVQDEGYRMDNPAARLPRIRASFVEPDPFTPAEVQQLLDVTPKPKVRLMIALAAFQGLRAGEVAAVHPRNVNRAKRLLLVREAKGGSTHEVWRPIHTTVWALLEPYLDTDEWLFPHYRSGHHVSSNSISQAVGVSIKAAGLDQHRPHQLRAYFATQLLESGADTMTVQFAMRHASQQTLTRYIRPSQDRIRAAMENLPQLTLQGGQPAA
jgi:integrase